MAVLPVTGSSVSFGGVRALVDASLSVDDGEIVGLIGPNGAGEVDPGQLNLPALRSQHRRSPARRRRRPQTPAARTRRRWGGENLSEHRVGHLVDVVDNVLLSAHHRVRSGFGASLVRPLSTGREKRRFRDEAGQVLDLVGLTDVAHADISELPYGTLKRVELAGAPVGRPRLVLLNEPANGLAHGEVDALAALIIRLRDALGLTVLLVEHHLGLVSTVCSRVVALVGGRIITSGTPAEVQSHPEVIAAYLGTRRTARAAKAPRVCRSTKKEEVSP